jgi:hypothetical protein
MAGVFASLTEALAILISGIGLLNLKSWARVTGILFIVFAMVRHIASNIYQLVFVMPGINRFMQQALPVQGGQEQKLMQTVITLGIVVGAVMSLAWLAYLLVTLILLCRASVRNALAGIGPEEGYVRDERGYDDRRRPVGDDYDEGWDARRPADDQKDEWRYKE